MDKVALLVRLQAKEGKEAEVEKFLCEALPVVENELSTFVWHADTRSNLTWTMPVKGRKRIEEARNYRGFSS